MCGAAGGRKADASGETCGGQGQSGGRRDDFECLAEAVPEVPGDCSCSQEKLRLRPYVGLGEVARIGEAGRPEESGHEVQGSRPECRGTGGPVGLLPSGELFGVFQYPQIDQFSKGIEVDLVQELEVIAGKDFAVANRALGRKFNDVG